MHTSADGILLLFIDMSHVSIERKCFVLQPGIKSFVGLPANRTDILDPTRDSGWVAVYRCCRSCVNQMKYLSSTAVERSLPAKLQQIGYLHACLPRYRCRVGNW